MDDARDIDRALAGIAELYTDNVRRYGTASASVGWKDDPGHRLRFAKLAGVFLGDAGERLSFNDLGCGYGALFAYLDGLAEIEVERYHGYDLSPEMLERARTFVPDRRASFHAGTNATTEVDYSLVSGTYHVKLDAPDDIWLEHVKQSLLDLFSVSRRGLAFNCLSSYVDWREDHLFYAEPCELFDFCKRRLAPSVVLLHDYPLYEWTIHVRRSRP
jgi:SAM-dependent methyltransferase